LLSIRTPGLVDTLCDDECLLVWEAVRAHRTPASMARLTVGTGFAPGHVQAALDRLRTVGLVESVSAGRGRRSVSYRVTVPALSVSLNGATRPEIESAIATFRKARIERFNRNAASPGSATPGDMMTCFAEGVARLTREEQSRIRSHVLGIVDTVKFAAHRESKRSRPKAPAKERGRPYALLVQIQPALHDPPALPSVSLTRDTGSHAELPAAGTRVLSAREREVAEGLAAGITRVSVAEKLGLSPHTIHTMLGRIYRKLGVSNRVGLVRMLRP
jgi:DNA-binding CsgD family transcriptional regulator